MFRNNLYINVNNIHRQFIREAAKKNILLLAGPSRPNPPPLEFIASFKSVPNRSETPPPNYTLEKWHGQRDVLQ